MKKLRFGQTVYYLDFNYEEYETTSSFGDRQKKYYTLTAKIINCNEKEVYIDSERFIDISEIFLTIKEATKEVQRKNKEEYEKHYGENSEFGKKTMKIINEVIDGNKELRKLRDKKDG